jgi:septal ring-binding cell division protein DamX
MNKSQLRKLAREHALGKLDDDEYRERRRGLVDGIVKGEVAIVREAAPPPPIPASANEATIETTLEREAVKPKLSPVYIGIGVVVVGLVVWTFLPSGKPRAPDAGVIVQAPLPAPQISRARALVEEFVASKDWGEFSLSRFKESWGALSEADREEAMGSRWFNDLTNAISEEIKTQNALVGFDDSGNAARTGKRLADFAAFLGVTGDVTEFKANDATTEKTVAPSARPENARVSRRKTVPTASGAKWLDEQPADALTLQLFAVNHTDKIQELISANPDIDLQVLVSAQTEPRYRVVYGTFDSAEAARKAHASLPEAIRRPQPTPLVKTIRSLRGEEASADWLAGLDAGKYTLQLFATDDADSARRLISTYSSLELSLLDTTDTRSRYRILYGEFDSETSAEGAVAELPGQLIRDAGKPLVKSVGELQAARR